MENIRNTMKTRGWIEIKQMFTDEITDNIKGIDTKGDIAVQYIGRIEAEKIIKGVFKKLDAIAYEAEAKPESYK